MPDTTNTKSDLEILTQLNADFLASAQNGDVRVAVTVLRWKVSGQAFPSPGFRVTRLPVSSTQSVTGVVGWFAGQRVGVGWFGGHLRSTPVPTASMIPAIS